MFSVEVKKGTSLYLCNCWLFAGLQTLKSTGILLWELAVQMRLLYAVIHAGTLPSSTE